MPAFDYSASPYPVRDDLPTAYRDYWEALQAIWFLFVLLQVESNASSFSPGRLDQYLLPFLRQDLPEVIERFADYLDKRFRA